MRLQDGARTDASENTGACLFTVEVNGGGEDLPVGRARLPAGDADHEHASAAGIHKSFCGIVADDYIISLDGGVEALEGR